MIHFDCDYMEGAHPLIMSRLLETNLEQTPGYGTDCYSTHARELIRAECGCPDAEVHFLVGGTQANSTIIDGVLRRGEGVVSADTGHINVHESGAVELGGHKVLPLPNNNGKISGTQLRGFLQGFFADETYEHMVIPGMVYISNPTEFGTLYSLEELEDISAACHENNLRLFMDGARLGYGLAAKGNNLTLKDIARLCDVFYIGGTKVGALFGEAVVIPRPGLIPHLFTVIKEHGALLAKGRLAGIQFETLFTDGLYYRIGEHAVRLAQRLKQIFVEKGYEVYIDSPTNQQFFILPNETIDRLKQDVTFELWGARGETCTPVRFVTSWATKPEDVEKLAGLL